MGNNLKTAFDTEKADKYLITADVTLIINSPKGENFD
jgi:hypothetical protein